MCSGPVGLGANRTRMEWLMAMVFNAVRKDRFQFEGGARANCSRTELNQGVADTAE
tara:strand:+ start:569 stop:736 length:168 start_codon:yes stop_codon:yes gene_type:complete